MFGATCTKCETALSEEEIKRQAVKIAEDAVKKAFKNLKLS
jgi:hypothetical protein